MNSSTVLPPSVTVTGHGRERVATDLVVFPRIRLP